MNSMLSAQLWFSFRQGWFFVLGGLVEFLRSTVSAL